MVERSGGYNSHMTIGVFDSGIGGEAVAEKLSQSFPQAIIHTVNDKEHVPYGDRDTDEIIMLTNAALQPLINQGCDIIVLACNTATAAAIEWLRKTYPEKRFIGLEPMVKPAAAMTTSGIIAVCATPATLNSSRYKNLKRTYAEKLFVIEPDCSGWASMIEQQQIDEMIVTETMKDICEQGADVIVLACTHYHWLRDVIEKTAAGKATVLDPSEAIARRVATVLKLS